VEKVGDCLVERMIVLERYIRNCIKIPKLLPNWSTVESL